MTGLEYFPQKRYERYRGSVTYRVDVNKKFMKKEDVGHTSTLVGSLRKFFPQTSISLLWKTPQPLINNRIPIGY